MKLHYLLFVLFLGNLGCAQSTAKPITEVSQKEFENVVLMDVRTPEEYAQGHIEGAVNINWFDPDFSTQVERIGKDETIFVYCKVGGRSAKAQKRLLELGYEKVVNLEGGYDAYSRSKR